MKSKKRLISLITALLTIVLFASTALAGSKQRHRWEGVAIGVGAAILGHAIYQTHRAERQPGVVYVDPYRNHRHSFGQNHRRGHWEWQQTWVPPIHERIWNPGHYNRKGHWVPGHWMKVEASNGHWTRERVWVKNNRCPF